MDFLARNLPLLTYLRPSMIGLLLSMIRNQMLTGCCLYHQLHYKAFDTVCHSRLLIKREACGITGILLKWITSCLSDRIQCTRIGQTLSCYNRLCSGIIQESVIGPLLFVVYINDIVDLFTNDSNQCTCKLHADDLK